MDKLTEGLWRWTARHPEWHPGEFGAEVASYAAQAGDTTLLIDPLLPPDPSSVLAVIDENLGKRLAVLITVPYHVRSAEELWKRYKQDAETSIHGHPACAKRLSEPVRIPARSTRPCRSRAASRRMSSGARVATRRRYTSRAIALWSSATLSPRPAVGLWCGRAKRSTPRSSVSTESASTRRSNRCSS